MIDFYGIMTKKTRTVKCHKCGKTMEVPNMYSESTRDKVLSPYCCTTSVFTVQWLIHHGWHIRNLGLTDSHPYFCPDCFEEGTPEYEARDYGKQWCEQAESWLNETKAVGVPTPTSANK